MIFLLTFIGPTFLATVMNSSDPSVSTSARLLLAGVWGSLCALIVAAPLAAAHFRHYAAAALYLFFAPVCHQIPERSFSLYGFPLAVCHRCAGIYLGLFLGSFFEYHSLHSSPRIRKVWILAASMPLLLGVLLSSTGLWTGSALSRFSTGLLFGIMLSSILVRAVAELLLKLRADGHLRDSHLKGGIS